MQLASTLKNSKNQVILGSYKGRNEPIDGNRNVAMFSYLCNKYNCVNSRFDQQNLTKIIKSCLKPAIFSSSKKVENNENRIYNIWPTKKSIVRCSNIQWHSLSCPIKQPPGAIELNLKAISQKRIGIIPTRHWFLDKSSTVHFIRASHAISCIRPTQLIILLLNLWSAPSPAAPLLEREIFEDVAFGPGL